MLGNSGLLSATTLCESEKLGSTRRIKPREKVLKTHTSHLMLPSNFCLKLATLIFPGSFQLEYSPSFSLHLETTEQQNSPACVNTEHVLKCPDQSRELHMLQSYSCA